MIALHLPFELCVQKSRPECIRNGCNITPFLEWSYSIRTGECNSSIGCFKSMLRRYKEANQAGIKNAKPQAHTHTPQGQTTILKEKQTITHPHPQPTHQIYKFAPAVFSALGCTLTPLTTTLFPFTPVTLTSTLSVPNPLAFSKKL
jgi:hypothetical protein